MATVQEPLERAESAVASMVRAGLPITARGIVAYLLRVDGVGCSMREAVVAARRYREAQQPKWVKAVGRVRASLAQATASLPADAVLRVADALERVDWSEEARAVVRARTKSRKVTP